MVAQFLAREDEQDRFVSVLRHALEKKNSPDEGFLVVVQGHGGIGKTELLNRFADIVRGKVHSPGVSNRFYVATVDWSAERRDKQTDYASWAGPPVWVAFDALYVSLREAVTGRLVRRRFERAFADYRAQAAKIKTGQTAGTPPSNFPDIVGSAIGVIGGIVPVPGAATVSGGVAKIASGLAQSAQNARGRVDDRVYDALFGSDAALVRAFANGVKQVSQRRPVVLILDTVEILGTMRSHIREAVQRSGARTVWVWGIRLEEETNAAEDSETMSLRRHVDNARLRLVPLSRFDDKTVSQFLRGRINEMLVTTELARDVVTLTRGIPLAVRIATNLLVRGVPPAAALREVSATGEVSEVIGGLARRYLIHLTVTTNPEMGADLALIYGLALMYGPASDPDLLAALWDIPAAEVAKKLDELAIRHDFVLSGQRRMHAEIRRTIQLFLLDPVRRPEVRAANERAIKALRERMRGLNQFTTVEAQLADEDWCAAATQLLWHTYWVSVRDGIRLLAELVPAAHTLAPSLAADLLRTASWFEPVFTAEQRAVVAGTRVLLPSGSFLNRLQIEFRRAAERLNAPPVVSSAMEVITDAADTTSGILAPDVPPTVFVLLLRLEAPVDNNDVRLVALLEQMVQILPANGAWHLREIIASRVEALARDVVGKPETKDVAASISRLAVQLAPGNAALQALLARACEAVGDLDVALEAIDETCQLEPSKANWHALRGVILRGLLRNEEALAAHEEACRLQPENAAWHGNRGYALGRLDRYEEALAAHEEVCRLQPENAAWHGNRGYALGRLDRYEEALAAHEEACRLQPENAAWHGNRGYALGRLDRYEEALAAHEEACRLQPENAAWHGNRGYALGRLDRYEEALAAYEDVCRLQPENADWHGNRGVALSRLDRHEEALAAHETGLRIAPDNANLLNNYGESLMILERDAEAVIALRRSISLRAEDSLESSVLLAVLLYGSKKEEAIGLCQTALNMPGVRNTECRRDELHALALMILGDPEEAERELRTALTAWTSLDIYQRRLYELLGDSELASGVNHLFQIWCEFGLATPQNGEGQAE